MLPVLFIAIIILAIKSITLPGAIEGLKFYLIPNFKNLSGEAVIAAIGQSFFSLGVGCGSLVVYGSYLDKDKTIGINTIMVSMGCTLSAILFGLIIFPAAFSYGIESTVGPSLVFITLPNIFSQMQFGAVFGTVFFILLFFACLTSTICIMEAIVSYLSDEWGFSRVKSCTIVAVIIWILGIVMMLSFGLLKDVLIFGRTIFAFSNDILVSDILLPLGGLLILILSGWILKPKTLLDEINTGEGLKVNKYYTITIKYIAPIAVLLVFLELIGVLKF